MKESTRQMAIKIHSWRLKRLGSLWKRNERSKDMFEGKKKRWKFMQIWRLMRKRMDYD